MDRIPVSAIRSAPVQTGPGSTRPRVQWMLGLFPAAKRPGYCVDHPTPSSTEVKERVQLYIYISSFPLGLHGLLSGELFDFIISVQFLRQENNHCPL